MCGPLGVWKWINYISGIIFGVLGLAIIIAFVLVSKTEFIKAIELNNFIKLFGIIFGCIMMLVGLIGWCAIKCESRCLICLYIFFIMCLILIFLVVWLLMQLAIGSKGSDANEMCDGMSTSIVFSGLSPAYPKEFCPKSESGSNTYHLKDCPTDKTFGPNEKICEGFNNVIDCYNSPTNDLLKAKYILPSLIFVELAKYLEKEKKCAGICNKCPYFLYTNCNDGNYPPTCDDEISSLFNSKLTNYQ